MDVRPSGSLREIVFILLKFKWSAMAIVAVTLLAALVYVMVIRDTMYEASSKIMVRIGQEQAPPPTVVGQPPAVISQRYQDVNTEIDILQSADLLGLVVDKFGLDRPSAPEPPPPGLVARVRYEVKALVRGVREKVDAVLMMIGLRERLTPREKAVYALQQGFIVTPQKDSNVLVAHLFLPVRLGAAPVLNAIIDEYLTFRLKLYYGNRTLQFFETEYQQRLADLRAAETELQRFEEQWRIAEIDKQKGLLLDQVTNAAQVLREARITRDQAKQKVNRLEVQLERTEPDVGVLGTFEENSMPARLMLELTELQNEREQLRMTQLDSDARIVNNRSRFNTVLGVMASNLRSALAEREAAYDARQKVYDEASHQLQVLHEKQGAWEALTRRKRLAEETYLQAHRKLQDARIESSLDEQKMGNVVVIERAIDPLMPSGMRKATMLGIALALAIFAALAWVSVAEFFDGRVYSADALEKITGAPALGVLPRVPRRRLRQWLRDGGAAGRLQTLRT